MSISIASRIDLMENKIKTIACSLDKFSKQLRETTKQLKSSQMTAIVQLISSSLLNLPGFQEPGDNGDTDKECGQHRMVAKERIGSRHCHGVSNMIEARIIKQMSCKKSFF